MAPAGFDLLLIIRGLAAVSVVIWHLEGYKATFPPVVNTPGRTAVWIFFGISGYVIAYGFLRGRYRLTARDLRHFYTNRMLRIYPLFLALSLLAWVTIWISTGGSPIGLADVPGQFLAFQFNQGYILSGVFWTLGIELQFYLLAPVLVLPLLLKGRTQVLVAAALYVTMLGAISYAVARHGWSFDGRNIVSNLPHFFIGMIACRLAWSSPRPRVPASVSLPVACALVGWASWLYHRQAAAFWSVYGILLVDAAVFMFVLAHVRLTGRWSPANSGHAAFAWLGTLSYGVYAWHAYLIASMPWMLNHLLLVIVLSIIAAYVSYRLIEAPALKLRRHPGDPPTAVRPIEVVPACS